MLIIAIPKSASSSLVETLCENHGYVNATADINEIFAKQEVPGVKLLYKYHSLPELDQELTDKIFSPEKNVYKLHMFPTENNKEMVRGKKKLILLRKPEDIVLAEKRAEAAYIHNKRNDFEGCETAEDWIQRARENGFYQDLENFVGGWRGLDDKATLYVTFEELIADPQKTMNRVEAFFELPQTRTVKLKKLRYSRNSGFVNFSKRVAKRGRRFLRRIKRKVGRRL